MFAEFKHTLRRLRGSVIGWSIGLGLYGLMMALFYDSVAEMEDIMALLENYPEEMLAFFVSIKEINTPKGYLDTYYFSYMTMIVGIFAIGTFANLLVGDEEKGVLDLIMAYPVKRKSLFWGRSLGVVVAIIIVLSVGWLSWVIPTATGASSLDVSTLALLGPFVSLFAILFLFGVLALMLSMIFPSGRISGLLSAGLLVANFLMLGMANLNEEIEPLVQYTPLKYYQGGQAIERLNWTWFAGLVTISLIFGLVAWARFERRDIRVGGERSWQLPKLAGLLSRS